MPKIKPIETHYNGYRFRSRLEARWAVFFDALGIEYEYEKEGYDLGKAGWYLPDFWFRQVEMWAEVKPTEFSKTEKDKCIQLFKLTGYECLLLIGVPAMKTYKAVGDYYGELIFKDYELSAVYIDQHRFIDIDYDGGEFGGYWDTENAVNAAKSARFEHGE